MNCSTEDTRVKVSSWTGDLDLVVVDASETVCQARCLGVKPVVVCEIISACTREDWVPYSSPEIHMQSTPVKNLSFSDSMNLSRFTEPFSSIPSKHILRLTCDLVLAGLGWSK